MNIKVLTIKPENCTGCQMCELACSSTKYGLFIPDKSRIKIITNGLQGWSRPMFCIQCDNAPCLNTCPVEALFLRELSTGEKIVEIKHDLCTKCEQCIDACPFGVIFMSSDQEIIKCDLCNGDPKCVQFCSYKCLEYQEILKEQYQHRMHLIDELINESKKKIKDLPPYKRRATLSLDLTRAMSKNL